MYRKPDSQLSLDDFKLSFEGKLSNENRRVKMAQLIPWDEIEQDYARTKVRPSAKSSFGNG